MNPTDIVRTILRAAPDALVVASLGTATSALRAASDDGPHFYMGGSMGTALAAAIGVAEKQSARAVIALLGDGEAVMGAGSFWSMAGIAPPNLLAIVLVDGHYTITGDQALGVPAVFGDVAAALGLDAATAYTHDEIFTQVEMLDRPAVLEVRYGDRAWPGPSPFVDPPVVRWRFEEAAKGAATPPHRPEPDDQLAKLERLGALRASGVLTAEEFQEQKRRPLGG